MQLLSHIKRLNSSVVSYLIGLLLNFALYVQGTTDGDLRLVGVNGLTGGMAGRVEVYYNNQWSTICQTSVNKQEANVICRQLGYTGSVYHGTVNDLEYVASNHPILSSVQCSGSESRIDSCRNFGIPSNNCSHSLELAVICAGTYGTSPNAQSPPSEGDLRLNTEGDSHPRSFSGRLEIYISGQWGTVCDDGFGQNEADTACRQLGFLSGLDYDIVGNIGFSHGSGSIWLEDITCSPNLTGTLLDCSHNRIGDTSCAHREDVALVCLGVGSLRLVEPEVDTFSQYTTGRLELYAKGRWGSVCDPNGFGQEEAEVACRQLGFVRAYGYEDVSTAGSTPPVIRADFECKPSDTFLLLCDQHERDFCSHKLAFRCTDGSPELVKFVLTSGIPILGLFVLVVLCATCCCFCCYWRQKRKKRFHSKNLSQANSTVQAPTAAPKSKHPRVHVPLQPLVNIPNTTKQTSLTRHKQLDKEEKSDLYTDEPPSYTEVMAY